MKRPAGWHLLVCVAAALALYLVISQSRQATAPGGRAGVVPQRPLVPPSEGPLMQIDPGDLARAGRQRDDNSLGMAFCWCPPGTFRMGGGVGVDPVRVTLSRGFWMGKFEMTQAQWQAVMGRTLRQQRARDPKKWRGLGDGTPRDHAGEGPDYPIYFTSDDDAEDFCLRFTAAERAAGLLEPGWEYRLPTEAQWEFACRAGTTTATAFGDLLGSTHANFDGTQPSRGAPAGPYLRNTTPVGSYPANAWGIHDMHGNVSEWCRDDYSWLPGGADPFVEPFTPDRLFRGGCWYDAHSEWLSTSRQWLDAETRGSGIGFRVALVPIGH